MNSSSLCANSEGQERSRAVLKEELGGGGWRGQAGWVVCSPTGPWDHLL